MANEIKRNTWTRFCKKFSASNQYRPTQLTMKQKKGDAVIMPLMPFMGVAINKQGRLIDGIRFFTGRADPENVVEPILTIKEPTKIHLEKDKNGVDARLRIRSRDGSETSLELTGDTETVQARKLVEQVAYSLYERHGYAPGNDMGDWFDAESKVSDAEHPLTQ